MNCRQIQNDLSAFVDGELSPTRKAEVETHINGCVACQQRVAELTKLAAGVAAMPKLQPAPQFLADVRRKLRAEPERPESWATWLFRPYWLKIPLEALALVIIAGLLLMPATNRARVRRGHAGEYAEPAPVAAPARAKKAVDQVEVTQEFRDLGAAKAGKVDKDELRFALPATAKPTADFVAGSTGRENIGTWVVTAADAPAVQAQAVRVAAQVGGRVLASRPAGWDAGNSRGLLAEKSVSDRADKAVGSQRFWVEMPASQEVQFRSELAQAVERQTAVFDDKLGQESRAAAEPVPASSPAGDLAHNRSADVSKLVTSSNEAGAVTLETGAAEAKSKSQVEPLTVLEIVVVPPSQ